MRMTGVAIDAGSGLAESLRAARGSDALAGDLLAFKRCVVRALSPLASTMLVDAELGPELLKSFAAGCAPMMAYEADVYRISNDDRITVVPDNLAVEDYLRMGVGHLKFFMYYAPQGDPALNDKKQQLVQQIGESCRENDVRFLFEPLVYHDEIAAGTADYARLKPELVCEATAAFADSRFCADVLKVEVPVDFDFVEGHGENLMSLDDAHQAFQSAAEAADGIPLVYLSAGVTFERFRASLKMARDCGVDYSGFMCGRAIWSDGVDVFGAGGEAALMDWLGDVGVERFRQLSTAAAP